MKLKLRKLLRDDGGQTLVITGLALTSLMGMAAFSVDVGVMFNAKRTLQTAADAGAIAGASEYNYTDVTAAAKAATAQNGMTDGSNGVTITVNNPPGSGTHTGTSSAVEVIAAKAVPTIFMKIFGKSTMTVKARAVAAFGPASGCIYTLDTSGIDVGMTGSGALSMPDCGIVIDSASTNALNLTGSATISALSIGIAGNYNKTGSGTISPNPVTGVAPEANPLAYLTAPSFSVASCLANPHFTGSASNTIGPAVAGGTVCYNGLTMTGSGSLTMNPGVYIINGAMSLTGTSTVSGSGVTIYLAPPSGSLTMTGSGGMNLTAPTSGTYNGILVFEDPSDTNAITVTGSSGSSLQGIFYAPAASLSFTGSGSSGIYADLVVSSLSMTGSTTINNYADVNANEPLVAARMVE
jgi:Flp pilus assembly protein TadG